MRSVLDVLGILRTWPLRRWWVAAAAALGFGLVIAIPTALIDNPVFTRMIPPTWWAWPSLVASSVLAGLLVATYVAPPDGVPRQPDQARARRGGVVGGVLTFFAVGCPICNKLVLLALGTAGALTWFEPVQPFLQLLAVGLLGWALAVRLRGEVACRTQIRPPSPTRSGSPDALA